MNRGFIATLEARLVKEKSIKRFMTSIKCGSCGQHYEVHNVEVLGHDEGMWFLRVLCSSCHTQCLVAAIIKEDKKPEIITDLTETEVGKFAAMDVVGGDDVLNMHRFLKDFDGDFLHIFERE